MEFENDNFTWSDSGWVWTEDNTTLEEGHENTTYTKARAICS